MSYADVIWTDRSGSVTTGGAAQKIMDVKEGRTGALVQNLSTGDLYVSTVNTVDTTNGIRLSPGALYEFPTNGVVTSEVWIYGATTGQVFVAKEW